MKTINLPKPFSPTSLLEILTLDIFEDLLTGFRERLKMGVAMYCKNREGQLLRIEPEEPRDRYWAKICLCFRSKQNGENICLKSDEIVAERFLNSNLKDGKVYNCDSLGLTDMVVPIRVFDKTLGVILSGQRLPEDEEEGLKLLSEIKKKYHKRGDDLEIAFFDDYSRQNKNYEYSNISNVNDIENRYIKLKEFGLLVSQICETSAEKQRQIRQTQFLEFWLTKLGEERPTNLIEWQRCIMDAFQNFITFIEFMVERIGLFIGEKENSKIKFRLIAMNSTKWWNSKEFNIPECDFMESKEFSPNNLPQEYMLGVGSDLKNKYFYVYPFHQKAAKGFGDIYSIIIFQSRYPLPVSTLDFIKRYSERICRLDGLTRLFLKQLLIQQEFEDLVTEIRHDLITSIQLVVSNIDMLLLNMQHGSNNSKKVDQNLKLVKRAISDHSERIYKLAPPKSNIISPKLTSVNIFSIVREQVELYNFIANEKSIRIRLNNLPTTPAYLVCEKSELDRGIAALLDNAIKYSFQKKDIYIYGKIQRNTVSIIFENYGIGIPSSKLKDIKKKYIRAEIPDSKWDEDSKWYRSGSGLGLSIAAYVFQDLLKGQLEIESYRPTKMEGKIENYHRYITRITIHLPVET